MCFKYQKHISIYFVYILYIYIYCTCYTIIEIVVFGMHISEIIHLFKITRHQQCQRISFITVYLLIQLNLCLTHAWSHDTFFLDETQSVSSLMSLCMHYCTAFSYRKQGYVVGSNSRNGYGEYNRLTTEHPVTFMVTYDRLYILMVSIVCHCVPGETRNKRVLPVYTINRECYSWCWQTTPTITVHRYVWYMRNRQMLKQNYWKYS